MSESASMALSILRDGSQFKWYVIPLLAFVFYVYTMEMEKKIMGWFLPDWLFGEWTGSMKSGIPWFFISPVMHRYGEHRVKRLI